MSNSSVVERGSPGAFLMVECDLLAITHELELPPHANGIAVLFRYRGRPVGFAIHQLPDQRRVTAAQITTWASESALANALAINIEEELALQKVATGDRPKLTIAVCTRNRPRYLRRCLSGLHGYTHGAPDIELLVVDNAPPDGATRTIVEQFPGVRYCCEQVPGLDFARNRAVSEGTGEVLAFVDDDAVVDPAWLDGLLDAVRLNPDAGAFTGPVIPLHLESRAQVLFELRGGFGRSFERKRFGTATGDDPIYPCNPGVFGNGCNMAFKRQLLVTLGGFDDALDTGPPLPTGGDIDMMYRVVAAGLALIYEPRMLVHHEHRTDYAGLRKQMWSWGIGLMTFVRKHQKLGSPEPVRFRRLIVWWFKLKLGELVRAFMRPNEPPGPPDLILAELWGAIVGLVGEYERSCRRVADRRRRYGNAAGAVSHHSY